MLEHGCQDTKYIFSAVMFVLTLNAELPDKWGEVYFQYIIIILRKHNYMNWDSHKIVLSYMSQVREDVQVNPCNTEVHENNAEWF
jgi:hypothetical protein